MRAPYLLRRAVFALFALLSAVLLTASPAPAQLFQQPTVIPTGNWPVAIYTADMNGDGFPDLIYIDQGATAAASTTHVLLNDGKGHFTQSAVVATAGNSVAIGDLTGSGTMSVGWLTYTPGTSSSGSLMYHIAEGSGTGTFSTPMSLNSFSTYAAPNVPSLAFLQGARLTSSGPMTLLAEDTANNQLLGCRFSSPPSPLTGFSFVGGPIPDGAGPIAVADLNGDGLNDVVVNAQSTGHADVFLQQKTGGLLPRSSPGFNGISGIHSLLVQDVNFDGIPDLIAEGAKGHVDVFPGNGDGTFSSTSIGGTGTVDGTTGNGGHLIVAADMNHDGLLDALAATPSGVSALLGNGTAYLGLKGIFNAGPGMHTFATADFNGDGQLDVATDSPEGIAILYGNPDGSFQTSLAYSAGQPAMSGDIGVFTTSGNTDAVVATAAKQAQLLLGHGDGTFSFQTLSGSPTVPAPTTSQTGAAGLWAQVYAVDVDNNGKLDLLLMADGSRAATPQTADGTVYQLGDGTGSFQAPIVPFASETLCSGGPGRLYGTGAARNGPIGSAPLFSAWIQSYDAAHDLLNITLSNGTADFSQSHPCGSFQHDLMIPGLFDLSSEPSLIEQQDSHLLLFPAGLYASGSVGDLNIDGSLTSSGQLTSPMIASTFGGMSSTFGYPAFPGGSSVTDLDGDGNLDLLVTYADLAADPTAPVATAPNYLYIWFGSGGGKFLTSAKHPLNPVRLTLSRNYYQVAVADLNGDGQPDLILSDGYIVSVQYGNGDGAFGAEQHFLAGQGINTISVADLQHKGVLDLVVANGGTVFSNVVMNKEVLTPNPDVSTGGVTVLLNGLPPHASAPVTTTGTLAAVPEPSGFEAAWTLSASFTTRAGGPTPTGTVSFTVDGAAVGAAPALAGGTASVAGPTTLLPGAHTLSAAYSGDANYPAATLTGSHTVSLGLTTVTLTPTTPLRTDYGGPANGLFTVNVQDPTYPASGTYTVLDNGVAVPICTNLPLTVAGVPVNCPYGDPILLDAGTHAFQVRYNGDAINGPATSAAVVFVITPDATVATLASSLNPASVGQAVTFTVRVTGTLAVPMGTVQILDGANVIASVALSGGAASFTTTTLAPGTHSITAVYPGTIDFLPTSTVPLTETILIASAPLASQTTLVSDQNPAPPGLLVTFTATVQAPGPFAQIPTGTVTFLDGATLLGTGALNSAGQASFATSTLAIGSHAMTASYGGDAAHGISPTKPGPQPPGTLTPRATTSSLGTLPSTSAVLTEIINSPINQAPTSFVLSVSPNPVTIGVGRTAVLLVTVRAVSGFSQAVTLSCTGNSMSESACTFALPSVPVGGGSTTLDLSTAAPHDCGEPNQPYFLGRNGSSPLIPAAVSLATLLGCGLLARKRRRLGAALLGLLTFAALGGLTAMSGCGHCTDLGTRPGSYSVTVTGTAADGTAQNVRVPVTVTIP